jgi:hypothetical protein
MFWLTGKNMQMHTNHSPTDNHLPEDTAPQNPTLQKNSHHLILDLLMSTIYNTGNKIRSTSLPNL